MTSLSINLPESLAKASQKAAGKLGISRTQFIRQAIAHELENLEAHLEQEAMISSITAMKKSKPYLKEANEITEGFTFNIPGEEAEWWNKEKS